MVQNFKIQFMRRLIMVISSFFDLIVNNADSEKFNGLSNIPLQGNVF